MPFCAVTSEVKEWSIYWLQPEKENSIHGTKWPKCHMTELSHYFALRIKSNRINVLDMAAVVVKTLNLITIIVCGLQ